MSSELQASLESEYGMDAEKAKLFSEKYKDQFVPPEPEPPEEETWRTEPATAAQIATINGYMEAIAADPALNEFFEAQGLETGEAEALKAQFLSDLGISSLEEMNGEEAQGFIDVLDATPAELWAFNLHWQHKETGGFSWPTAMVIIAGSVGAIGVAYKLLNNHIGAAATQQIAQEAANQVPAFAHATSQLPQAAKPGFWSRLVTRLKGGGGLGGAGGGTFLGTTPAFALLQPDPLGLDPSIAGQAGLPTTTVTPGGITGLQTMEVGINNFQLGGEWGFLDPETGEFKVRRQGLLGLILGPKVTPATEVQRILEEEKAEERAAAIAAANIAAIQRSGPRRTISQPGVLRFEKTRI